MKMVKTSAIVGFLLIINVMGGQIALLAEYKVCTFIQLQNIFLLL